VNVRIEVQDAPVREALSRLVAMGENPAPALHAIGRLFKEKTQRGFQTSTDPYGRPWAPLKVRSGQPLLDKGHLLNSIDYQVEGNSVEIGTNNPHALTHQKGATIVPTKPGGVLVFPGPDGKLIFAKKVTIPARMIFPTDGLPEDWSAEALDAIGDAMRATWDGGSNP